MTAAAAPTPLLIKGWLVYAHPVFIDQLEALIAEVEALKAKNPDTYTSKGATKRLAVVRRFIFEDIPADPTRADYRQGGTLGPEHTHWHRAKFYQQYRLFFRFNTASKVIILGWVNDDSTLREYDSKSDAYLVFRKMLNGGRPPTDWKQLLAEASTPAAVAAFEAARPAPAPAAGVGQVKK